MARKTATIIDMKAMAASASAAELPATMPVLVESNVQVVQWRREIDNALDERGFVDEQIESARRIRNATDEEAQRVFDAALHIAELAKDRAIADADRLCAAAIEGLQRRQANQDAVIAGLEAAVAATSAAE